ncbi:hypothetical protein QE375_000947 [Microbacterium foliorum]|uniref:Uncharacterized protein n=1 Tax=Microbacterium foliorum TaxID=104336 RepID=A0ABU1HMX5_9MICO|nr:hypothetical protein [Microbacterium foliorum]MDR6141393.1 hypothetical protein [Microbacterium foliorum]
MSNVWDAFGDDETSARRIAEWLLVETVGDLEHRCRDGATAYDRLGISAVLRRLLTDRHKILHPAIARLALPKPVFHFTPYKKPYEHPEAKLRIAIAFGNPSEEPRTHSGNLEAFLASVAAYSFGEPVSVKDVIRQFAHTYGGVHLGKPGSPFERSVQRAGAVMPYAVAGWSKSLVGIATVTLDAIKPIANDLKASPYPPPKLLGSIPSNAQLEAMREQRRLD